MQSVLSLLLSVLASLSSSVPGRIVQGRTECPEGYILWPEDSSCHRPYYRGPCSGGQVLINHPQVRIKEELKLKQFNKGPCLLQGPLCEFRDNAQFDKKVSIGFFELKLQLSDATQFVLFGSIYLKCVSLCCRMYCPLIDVLSLKI